MVLHPALTLVVCERLVPVKVRRSESTLVHRVPLLARRNRRPQVSVGRSSERLEPPVRLLEATSVNGHEAGSSKRSRSLAPVPRCASMGTHDGSSTAAVASSGQSVEQRAIGVEAKTTTVRLGCEEHFLLEEG